MLDRVADLGEPGCTRDEEPDTDDEEHRDGDAGDELPRARERVRAGALVRHASSFAARPRAAPAIASRT